jgi:hypothetical protein
MIPYSELHTVYAVSKLRWIPAVVLFIAEPTRRIFLGGSSASFLNIILWRRIEGWNSAATDIFLLLGNTHFPFPIPSWASSMHITEVNTAASLFLTAENVWLVQAVNRNRAGWTGVNSVDINWIIYRDFIILRALMIKATFPPWTCLWHWRVNNPSWTKHTDSREILMFVKIYILQCRWLLLLIMLFGKIVRNSNLWCFYHFKTVP